MVAELRLGRTSATNEWVVKFREPWRHRVVISGDDGFPHVQSVREFQQYPEGWCAYIFAHSFPRQSRSLRFRLEERNSFRDDWRLVTTFETRNPKRSRTEQWSTNKTVTVNAPNGVQAEIAEITVDLSTNANLPSEYIATFPVRFTQSGVVLTNWVIMNSTLTDATGNYGWLSGRSMWVPISDGWRMHRVRPLDPTVPWRLRFNFAQDADFPKTNLLSFSVTWPLAGTIYTNLAGKPMRIGFVNTYMLDVELMSKDSDVRLTFVSATDDSGADLDDSSGSWGQHSFWKSLKLRNTSKPVQIKATVAIHPNFTNEVILQPRFVSR